MDAIITAQDQQMELTIEPHCRLSGPRGQFLNWFVTPLLISGGPYVQDVSAADLLAMPTSI